MIMAIKDDLSDRGISSDQIHYELFSTPPTEAVETEAAPADTGDRNTPIASAEMMVVLDGDEVELNISSSENILDAALDAGIDAPYACTGGSCCTCRAKITEGHAIMDVNYALTDKEVEDGYVLTCQAHPTTPSIVVDYDEP